MLLSNLGEAMKCFLSIVLLASSLYSQVRIQRDVNNVNAPSARAQVMLNGMWDFCPILDERRQGWHRPAGVPQEGWLSEAVMVPGSWTRGFGNPGEDDPLKKFWAKWRLFDSYGYPEGWDKTLTAWYRRTFTLDEVRKDSRYFLYFGGVLRESWVFINGQTVGISLNGILPNEYDVTEVLQPGQNVLLVYCTDYRRDDNGRTFTPIGADQMMHQAGIWQDVMLVRRPDLYIEDVTVRTSVRRNDLTLLVTLYNASRRARVVTPLFTVMERHLPQIEFSAPPVHLEAGERRQITVSQRWASYTPWSPHTPQLYELVSRLTEKDAVLDERRDRFGFREVWIESPHLMLNGEPIHLFGDWCHKNSFDSFRPEYVRQWFRMLKDANMNYIRTHAFPHPALWLDLADEMGILVSVESAWFFTHDQALDKEELWKNAEQHVRAIIARDKNHPSVILWSIGNEVRWGWNRTLTVQNMPRLRRIYEELDPTRIAYHDGDTSLWDESEQSMISRHYGVECSGDSWWDRSRPLHVGEVGKWHYSQPIDNLIWGDDSVFASFEATHRAIARECADLAEQARANDVTCFFPWNLSGLDNWRPWSEERTFRWNDLTAPGLKPLRSAPYGSEFAWWDEKSPGYEPGPSFEIIRRAFRPFALIVREKRGQVYSDRLVRHTVTLVNDTGGTVTGTLAVNASIDGRVFWKRNRQVTLANGRTQRFELLIPPPSVNELKEMVVESRFFNRARVFDENIRRLSVMPAGARSADFSLPMIAVFGDGSMNAFIRNHRLSALRLTSLADADPAITPILLIEKDAVVPGTGQNQDLASFLRRGGRALLLEQSASIFPQLKLENQPVERVHIRGGWNGPLAELNETDLEYWGDDPYGSRDSDAWVVSKPYWKPAVGDVTVFLHSGGGDFGSGGLLWTPLFETRIGKGLLLACQLRVTDKLEDHPAALKLLFSMLNYLAEQSRRERRACGTLGRLDLLRGLGIAPADTGRAQVIVASSQAAADTTTCRRLANAARSGKTVVITQLDAAAVQTLRSELAVDLRVIETDTVYNLVRREDDILLEGISHQETYWLDRGQYSPLSNVNHAMTTKLLSCPTGEELLVSEYASAWREFFVLGASSELLRMPVMTSSLWNGPRRSAAGLLRLRVGSGEMLLCQIPYIHSYEPSRRFWNGLLSNLGVQSEKTLLDGDRTTAGIQHSEGFPRQVRCLFNPGPQTVQQVLSYRMPFEYRLPNDGLTAAFMWAETAVPGGRLTLDDAYREVLIYTQIDPGRPRRRPTEDEVSEGDQQTTLTLRGSGRVIVYVNGRKHDEFDLSPSDHGSQTDMELNRYWNTVILRWFPRGGRTLNMMWRNRRNQAETEFIFN